MKMGGTSSKPAANSQQQEPQASQNEQNTPTEEEIYKEFGIDEELTKKCEEIVKKELSFANSMHMRMLQPDRRPSIESQLSQLQDPNDNNSSLKVMLAMKKAYDRNSCTVVWGELIFRLLPLYGASFELAMRSNEAKFTQALFSEAVKVCKKFADKLKTVEEENRNLRTQLNVLTEGQARMEERMEANQARQDRIMEGILGVMQNQQATLARLEARLDGLEEKLDREEERKTNTEERKEKYAERLQRSRENSRGNSFERVD